MTGWNAIFEVEQVKKLPLVTRLSTHHDPSPPLNESKSSRESCRAPNHEPFFDNIGPFRPFAGTRRVVSMGRTAQPQLVHLSVPCWQDPEVSRAGACCGDQKASGKIANDFNRFAVLNFLGARWGYAPRCIVR